MASILDKAQVVATAASDADLDDLETRAAPSEFDWVEYRLDHFVERTEAIRAAIARGRWPALLTLRSPDEGGAVALSDDERAGRLRPLIGSVDALDLEVASLRSSEALRALVPEAKKGGGVQLVTSFHDFGGTPSVEQLREVIDEGFELGADLVKIAVVLDRFEAMFELAGLLESEKRPLSLMGMGALGRLSRLVLARAGSRLNYGFLTKETAPGQWQAGELKRLIGKL